jgi:hypothetical protein
MSNYDPKAALRSVRPCHFGGNSTQSSSRTGNTHLRRQRAEHCEMGRFYGITETWNNLIYGESDYPYPQVGLYAFHTRLKARQCGAGRKHDTRMKPRGWPTQSSRFVSFESEKRVRQGSPDPPRMREAALIFVTFQAQCVSQCPLLSRGYAWRVHSVRSHYSGPVAFHRFSLLLRFRRRRRVGVEARLPNDQE